MLNVAMCLIIFEAQVCVATYIRICLVNNPTAQKTICYGYLYPCSWCAWTVRECSFNVKT